jgi:hypothetical protein
MGSLITISLVLSEEVSASDEYCPESKDGSQDDPACISPGSRGECNKDLAGGHKDFKCVKQPENPQRSPAASDCP